jgi:hypothetical protein
LPRPIGTGFHNLQLGSLLDDLTIRRRSPNSDIRRIRTYIWGRCRAPEAILGMALRSLPSRVWIWKAQVVQGLPLVLVLVISSRRVCLGSLFGPSGVELNLRRRPVLRVSSVTSIPFHVCQSLLHLWFRPRAFCPRWVRAPCGSQEHACSASKAIWWIDGLWPEVYGSNWESDEGVRVEHSARVSSLHGWPRHACPTGPK